MDVPKALVSDGVGPTTSQMQANTTTEPHNSLVGTSEQLGGVRCVGSEESWRRSLAEQPRESDSAMKTHAFPSKGLEALGGLGGNSWRRVRGCCDGPDGRAE